jgi:transcriptional regulator with XRE-family HTH domain
METIGKRIQQLRKSQGLNQTEFARLLGLKQGVASMWETGTAPLSEKTIKAICYTFHVSEQWLRTGEGEMFTNEDPAIEEFLAIYRTLSLPFRKMFLEYGRFLIEQQARIPPS